MRWLIKKLRELPTIGADYVGVFLLVALVYGVINASSSFLDPDSFYHVKMAELLLQRGIVRDFVWLPYTTLAHAYADHHFLYHIILIPFITFYGSFVGAKIATVVLAAAALTTFYWALKVHGGRLSFAFTMLLMANSAFLFRMNLTKTSSLSVAVLMLALIAIRKEKAVALFFLSWVYVLLYGGWPIMGVVVFTFLAARAAADRALDKHPLHSWGHLWFWKRLLSGRKNALADFFAVQEVRLAAAALAGLVCGLVINPYFPANLQFYWQQIVQIAVLNYHDKIGVGAEWYPYPHPAFFFENGIVFLSAAGVLVLALAQELWPDIAKQSGSRKSRKEFSSRAAAFILAGFFCFMTLRSRRHVEYFVPFAMFAIALWYSAVSDKMRWPAFGARIRDLLPKEAQKHLAFDTLLKFYVVAVFLFFGVRNLIGAHSQFSEGIPWTRYATAAEWMNQHVPEGSIIVHSDWDEFPVLFYHDDMHRYVCGLDPTFLYLQDPVRYWLWVNVTTGKLDGDVSEKIRDGLGAKYFFVDTRYKRMAQSLERDPNIVRVYSDADATIYAIR